MTEYLTHTLTSTDISAGSVNVSGVTPVPLGSYNFSSFLARGSANSPSSANVPVTISAPPVVYTVQGITFNSPNAAYMTTSSLTGIANGQKGILSTWLKLRGVGAYQIVFETMDDQSITMYFQPSGYLFVQLTNSAGTPIVSWTGHNVFSTSGGLSHVAMSWDTTVSRAQAYTDGLVDVNAPTVVSGGIINYAYGAVEMGGRTSASSMPFIGDIGDFYFNTAETMDLSVPANLAKFIDSSGNPVNLGTNGATPTGSVPLIFLSGPSSTFANNLGSGGAFSLTGSISNGSTKP